VVAADPRGLSNLGGIFSSTTNPAGGKVWTSTGTISQNDFAAIVNSELMQGKNVSIISGVHDGVDGSVVVGLSPRPAAAAASPAHPVQPEVPAANAHAALILLSFRHQIDI
jgi:hypothetical protein